MLENPFISPRKILNIAVKSINDISNQNELAPIRLVLGTLPRCPMFIKHLLSQKGRMNQVLLQELQ